MTLTALEIPDNPTGDIIVAYDRIQVTRLAPHIGAEIGGIDLCAPLDSDVIAQIRRALVEHQVVFFRDQPLSVEQHKTFASHFGEMFRHPASVPVEGHPELIRIHADANSTKVAGEQWHTDTSCEAAPPMGSILHLHTMPATGGDTLFASMYAAYEGLSASLQDLLEPLTAHHSGGAAYRGYYGNQGQRDYPESDHPIVCVHPESGRKLLYVNAFYTTHINELTPAESDALLAFLFRHITTPEYQCRFRWRKHSVAFWDNRCTQHRAIWDYYPAERSGYRIQIVGSPPVAARKTV